MFEKASRKKLRFNYRGICTVEDLWDIPLTELNSMYKDLNKRKKYQEEGSLLNIKSEEDEIVALQLEIIIHVVTVRLQEAQDKKERKDKALRKKKLLGILAEKQYAELLQKPSEEIARLIEEL